MEKKEDLISRQAAIDACLKGKTEGLPATNVACDCCAERIRVLPSAQQWIPCSERLPEKSDDYLCTYGSLSGWFVDISIYETEKKEFGFYSENEHGEDVWYPVTNVVAWMELPKPWKEGQP